MAELKIVNPTVKHAQGNPLHLRAFFTPDDPGDYYFLIGQLRNGAIVGDSMRYMEFTDQDSVGPSMTSASIWRLAPMQAMGIDIDLPDLPTNIFLAMVAMKRDGTLVDIMRDKQVADVTWTILKNGTH